MPTSPPLSQQQTESRYDHEAPYAGRGTTRICIISVLLAAGAFLTVLLIINHTLFTAPIMEYGDPALNALQIESAKHFRELLGNYSRWGFHHPGPAFFYIFAFGEVLFRDLLHLVPAEMNAHILTILLVNTAFLFGSIGLIAKRCFSRLFTPAALALSLFFVYVLNHAVHGSAVLSIWPPHILMFCFLFFVVVGAAVALGEPSKLPLLFLSGLLLLHEHAAQPLFVGPLMVLSLATLWFRQGRLVGLHQFLRQNRRPVAISLLLCVLFATPIVLDILLHKPNNIDHILFYSSEHRGIQHKPRLALKYEVSFLDFIPDTEVQLRARPTHLMSIGGSQPYVVAYWCIACTMLGVFIGIYAVKRRKLAPLFKYLAVEIAFVLILFYVWTLKMGGELLSFNGYFLYGMQLLALLIIAALILDGLELTARPSLVFALCALIPVSMFAAKPEFTSSLRGDQETNRIYDSIPPNVGPIHFTFSADNIFQVAGVVNRMKREGRPFCIDDVWASVLGSENVCHELDGLSNLVLTNLGPTMTPAQCNPPCRVLLRDNLVEIQLIPYPFLKLPFAIKPESLLTLNTEFHGASEGSVWSSKKSTIHFRLDRDFSDAPRVRVRLLGTAIVDHPAQIILNGHYLGSIVAGPAVSDFIVDRSVLLAGTENRLVIQVEKTAKAAHDPRALGFFWTGLQLDGVK